MGTYTQLLYQIVFSTKYRSPTLLKSDRKKLYRYLWGILNNYKCHVYRINGVEDHLHIVTHIHQTVPISVLVKELKVSSNKFIKQENLFPDFTGWQDGYGAFTYNIKARDRLIEYVKNQEEHHKNQTFKEEYIKLLKKHEIEFEEQYLL